MDQYIKQLLLLHSKIILPKFGAIVLVNEETGELSFNEYLSYDDGKLSALLESESNMDLQEAQNSVAKYVRDLKLQLNKGETYSIFQLGEFSKDKDGAFIFEGNLKTGGKAGSDVSNGPSPTPVAETNEEKKDILPKPEAEKAQENTSEQENILPKPEEKEPEKPIQKATAVPEPTPKKVTETPEGKKNIYVEKGAQDKSTTPPVNEQQTVIVEKEKKRRKGFLFWFLLILLLLIVTGTVLVFTNQEKVEEYMGWSMFDKKKATDKNAVKVEPKAVEKEEITMAPIEEETPVEENTEVEEPVQENITSSTGKHHIIAGCFGEKSNADKMVNNLKQQGFDSKIISQQGGLYFVAAQSYPTSKAAYSDLSRVKQIVSGAWLYKY